MNNDFFLMRFKRAMMADDEFTAVETYLHSSQYPKGMTKGEKANFRRKCKIISSLKLECYITRKMVLTRHHSGRYACDQTMKKGGYLSHAILEKKVCTYKLYNLPVSQGLAVGCHLGRDKTIEKVSSRFY